jgi:hypothetical protein
MGILGDGVVAWVGRRISGWSGESPATLSDGQPPLGSIRDTGERGRPCRLTEHTATSGKSVGGT